MSEKITISAIIVLLLIVLFFAGGVSVLLGSITGMVIIVSVAALLDRVLR